MTINFSWGPQAGFARTGTLQSIVDILDFLTGEDDDAAFVSISSTSFVFEGFLNNQRVTVNIQGTGFTEDPDGGLGDTGTVTGFEFFAGTGTSAGQRIARFESEIDVNFINTLIEADLDGIDPDGLENFWTGMDWTYNGIQFADNFPATIRSADGFLLNLRGNDLLNLGGGNDSIFAGDGDDTVNGGNGFDTIEGGLGNDIIDGGDLADRINGNEGNDSLVGGLGFDVLFGDAGNDTLDGGATPDRLFGGDGDDLIMGGSNFSLTVDGLFGEAGNDTIFGQAGFDLLNGGAGDDLLDGGNQADNLLGGAGNDTMFGGQGLDRLFGGDGDDLGRGGIGTDGMFGEFGNDTLFGEEGNDRFFGGAGNDVIFGGADDDTVFAGAGFDTIDGGEGNDILQGNFNADTFVFADGHGNDTISDFTIAGTLEVIDLSAITAITDFADLVANHIEEGPNGATLIDTGNGNSIQVNGVREDTLDILDFIF